MAKNIDNNANNIENKDTNKFKDFLNSLKRSIENKKNKESINDLEKRKNRSKTEESLEYLNNDIKKWVEIKKVAQDTKLEVNEFMKEWVNEINKDKKHNTKKGFEHKYDTINSRPETTQEWINDSIDDIVDEYKNRKQEKNPIARWLLRVVNRIMNSEKIKN